MSLLLIFFETHFFFWFIFILFLSELIVFLSNALHQFFIFSFALVRVSVLDIRTPILSIVNALSGHYSWELQLVFDFKHSFNVAAIVGNIKHRLLDHSLLTAVMKQSSLLALFSSHLKVNIRSNLLKGLWGKGGSPLGTCILIHSVTWSGWTSSAHTGVPLSSAPSRAARTPWWLCCTPSPGSTPSFLCCPRPWLTSCAALRPSWWDCSPALCRNWRSCLLRR